MIMSTWFWLGFVAIVAVSVVLISLVLRRWTKGIEAQYAARHQARLQAGFQPPIAMGGGPIVPASQGTQVKNVRCFECGARKLQPAQTAFLYCDYCGALVDYDFRTAIARGWNRRPGQVLRELMQQERELRAHAVRTGDRQAYEQSSFRMIGQHMALCPEHYSPRIADPSYREAFLRHRVAVAWTTEHDPEHVRVRNACIEALQAVTYHQVPGQIPRADSVSLRRFVDAAKAYMTRYFELSETQLHLHPDQPSAEALRAFELSKMVQNWLPLLGPEDQAWLIAELGMSDDYVTVEPVATQQRHCGHCAALLEVVQGARRVLCFRCGHHNDVGAPEIACATCGAEISIPVGAARLRCPHCGVEMQLHR